VTIIHVPAEEFGLSVGQCRRPAGPRLTLCGVKVDDSQVTRNMSYITCEECVEKNTRMILDS